MKCCVFLSVAIFIFSSCKKTEKTLESALKMQEFVIAISQYAKAQDIDFLIIPQNGEELAFSQANPDLDFNYDYLNAIDAFGVEEIFFNGEKTTDEYRLKNLQKLRNFKPVFVSEFISDQSDISDALNLNQTENFICFPRSATNYYYTEIPDEGSTENDADIDSLSNVQNYLYLLNSENFTTKSDYLNALHATNFDLLLIDLFYEDQILSASDVNALKTKSNGGKRLVVAYMNIGSAEKFRYYWQPGWKKGNPDWLKKKYDGYKDEIWVEFWNDDWQNIMLNDSDSYINQVLSADFDGVYLDNTEAYYFLYHRN